MTQDKALKALQSGANIFLTGEPGAGKTYTFNRFVSETKNKRIAVTASSGYAATHIDGRTIHSWAGIGIKKGYTDDQFIGMLEDDDYLERRLNYTDALLIDEISMLCGESFDDIERMMSIANGTIMSGKPFGGKQIVVGGDFFQLPPVYNKQMDKKKPEFAFDVASWTRGNFEVCYLTEQHRQEDMEFLGVLTALRAGVLKKEHLASLKSRIKATPPKGIFTRLFTGNANVDQYNTQELHNLTGEPRVFEMKDEGYPSLVAQLKKYCTSPETLVLKLGALVMFTRNNMDAGYVNGTLGRVVRFTPVGPIVETKDGQEILVSSAIWNRYGDNGNIIASITQLPLKLAWAMTVHKSQGVSLDGAVIDLRTAFEYGMGYVALSRVRSLDGLYLIGLNDMALKMHPEIVEQDKLFRELSAETEKKYA